LNSGPFITAVRLFAQIENRSAAIFRWPRCFQSPTIKQLARVLREQGWPASWSSLVMIQGGGKRTPFFCIHAAGGKSSSITISRGCWGRSNRFMNPGKRAERKRGAAHEY